MSRPLTLSDLNAFFKADAKRSRAIGLNPLGPSLRKGESLASFGRRVAEESRRMYENDLGMRGRFEEFMANKDGAES